MEKRIIKLANGKTCESGSLYQYSNEDLLASYNLALSEGREDDANEILKSILGRFQSDLCRRDGETKDELFARQFGDFVNGKMGDKNKVAQRMGCDHRYLQNEMFHVCLAYIKVLAENCERGYYDGRNKYAAETSKKIIDHLKEIDYPY